LIGQQLLMTDMKFKTLDQALPNYDISSDNDGNTHRAPHRAYRVSELIFAALFALFPLKSIIKNRHVEVKFIKRRSLTFRVFKSALSY